jgi:hypothetical protein
VFPNDTTGDVSEASPNDKPFFQATFKTMRWMPSFPFALSWLAYVGLDLTLGQPPLPEGKGSSSELPGTDRWCSVVPGQATKSASLGWVDMSQKNDKGVISTTVGHENFWPGLGRWQLGVKFENSDIEFGEGKYWDAPHTERIWSVAEHQSLCEPKAVGETCYE